MSKPIPPGQESDVCTVNALSGPVTFRDAKKGKTLTVLEITKDLVHERLSNGELHLEYRPKETEVRKQSDAKKENH